MSANATATKITSIAIETSAFLDDTHPNGMRSAIVSVTFESGDYWYFEREDLPDGFAMGMLLKNKGYSWTGENVAFSGKYDHSLLLSIAGSGLRCKRKFVSLAVDKSAGDPLGEETIGYLTTLASLRDWLGRTGLVTDDPFACAGADQISPVKLEIDLKHRIIDVRNQRLPEAIPEPECLPAGAVVPELSADQKIKKAREIFEKRSASVCAQKELLEKSDLITRGSLGKSPIQVLLEDALAFAETHCSPKDLEELSAIHAQYCALGEKAIQMIQSLIPETD